MTFTRHGAEVVAGDISTGMLAEGRRRHPKIDFIYADAMDLPFADDGFDVVTISFGIRNVHDVDTALAEMLRVLKPGGRLVICEFSTPTCGRLQPRVQGVPDAGAAGRGPRGVLEPRGLCVPGRVDPRLAEPGGLRPPDPRRRVRPGEVPQPHRRHRRRPPRPQTRRDRGRARCSDSGQSESDEP
jgi:SAM-dependent methyltransferase